MIITFVHFFQVLGSYFISYMLIFITEIFFFYRSCDYHKNANISTITIFLQFSSKKKLYEENLVKAHCALFLLWLHFRSILTSTYTEYNFLFLFCSYSKWLYSAASCIILSHLFAHYFRYFCSQKLTIFSWIYRVYLV